MAQNDQLPPGLDHVPPEVLGSINDLRVSTSKLDIVQRSPDYATAASLISCEEVIHPSSHVLTLAE